MMTRSLHSVSQRVSLGSCLFGTDSRNLSDDQIDLACETERSHQNRSLSRKDRTNEQYSS
jgi:hypothetical protein